MAKALVTQERVFEVAQALTDQGTAPTILNVQEEIGGGQLYVATQNDVGPDAQSRGLSDAN
jgi:hypothetical protein